MFAIFLTPAYAPFAIAFVVMIGIGLIEAIGLGLGHLDLDADVPADADSGGALDWLGLGHELPILIWLTSLLGCFTLAGIAIQKGSDAMTGSPLHWGLASGGALIAGSLLNTLAASGLARVMPSFETSVISTDDFLRAAAPSLKAPLGVDRCLVRKSSTSTARRISSWSSRTTTPTRSPPAKQR